MLYKLFYTHNRSKDIGHFSKQNLFKDVHAVGEEEATWGGRLPCAFLQSLTSGIPLPQPIIMVPYTIHQNSPSVVPSTRQRRQKITHESNKRHIKNLSDIQLTTDQTSLLSKGLRFIPTPVTKENSIRHQLMRDFNQFARRMRLQYIYHGENNEPHPFHVKTNWEPPAQQSVALET